MSGRTAALVERLCQAPPEEVELAFELARLGGCIFCRGPADTPGVLLVPRQAFLDEGVDMSRDGIFTFAACSKCCRKIVRVWRRVLVEAEDGQEGG